MFRADGGGRRTPLSERLHQFGLGGTDALESEYLWDMPDIRRAGGLAALRPLGKPADVLREAKVRLFGV